MPSSASSFGGGSSASSWSTSSSKQQQQGNEVFGRAAEGAQTMRIQNPEMRLFLKIVRLLSFTDEYNPKLTPKLSEDINWSEVNRTWNALKDKITDLVDPETGQTLLSWLMRIDVDNGLHSEDNVHVQLMEDVIQHSSQKSLVQIDKKGWMPLHYACVYNVGKETIIEKLLSADKLKGWLRQSNKSEQKPLHLACEYGASQEIIATILRFSPTTIRQKLLMETNEFGKVPLHLACDGAASPEVVKLLLEADKENVSIYAKDEFGSLPLHLVCKQNSTLLAKTEAEKQKGRNATIETIKLLRDQDSNHFAYTVRDSNGKEPLKYIASINLMSDMIQDALDRWDLDWMELLISYSDARTFSDGLLNNLKEDACIFWLTAMSCENTMVFSLMLQLYCHALWMVAFVWSSILFAEKYYVGGEARTTITIDDNDDLPKLLSLLLVPAAILFIIIELLQVRQLFKSNALGSYFLNGWNWLDVSTIVLVLVSAYHLYFVDPVAISRTLVLCCITFAFQMLLFLAYLRQVSLPFAIFVGGLLQILKALIPFVIVLTLVLVTFAFMYYMTELDNIRGDGGSNFGSAMAKVTAMLFTGPEEVNTVLDVAYGFLLFIVLLNGVVLAVVSNEWSAAAEESYSLFWQYRLNFIQETRRKRNKDNVESNALSVYFHNKFDNLLDLEEFKEFMKSREEPVSKKVGTCIVLVASFFLGLVTFGLGWCMPIREFVFVGGSKSSSKTLNGNDPSLLSQEDNNTTLKKKVQDLEQTILDLQNKIQDSMDTMQNMLMEKVVKQQMEDAGSTPLTVPTLRQSLSTKSMESSTFDC